MAPKEHLILISLSIIVYLMDNTGCQSDIKKQSFSPDLALNAYNDHAQLVILICRLTIYKEYILQEKCHRMRRVSSTGSVISLPSRNVSPTKLFAVVKGREGPHRDKPGTPYCSTLMNLIKGTLGTGIFAMGGALKHAGLVLGPVLLVLIGTLCVYCQHQLVGAAHQVAFNHDYNVRPDYAETVMVCFMDGPEVTRNLCFLMKKFVNTVLIICQMGFCCVYLVFIGDSLKRILAIHDIHTFSIRTLILFTALPIWLMSLLNNLKLLVPMSIMANIFTVLGILITLYYNCLEMPDPLRLPLVGELGEIPLFLGTALFSFESIGLVLPLYNEMKKPKHLLSWYGVLNVGMSYCIAITTLIAATSYIKWGENIKPSVTLNLPGEILAEAVVIFIMASVALSYVLQMYVAYMIMFPWFYRRFGPFRHHYWAEISFKTILSVITYILAETIPYLGEFITLVGALGGTSLSLVFPPVLELIVFYETIGYPSIFKNIVIIVLGFTAIISATYVAIHDIIINLMRDAFQ